MFYDDTHKMQYLCDFSFDNILLRSFEQKIGHEIESIPVYYFRNKNYIQVRNLKYDLKKYINVETIKHSIFYNLKEYAK